jgi:CTP:molybdopterin cytidylyltransferase MocA
MISSIVLAAGQSTRMGSPKPLLDWGGEPLIAYQVKQLKEAGVDEVVVVLGYRSDDIHREIRRLPCRVMLNARYQLGRARSLQIGAKAVNRDADAIVVLNVDQPRPAAFIREVLAAHQPSSAATRPVCNGRHGHPVVVSGRLRQEMMEATDEGGGLRGILRAHADELAELPAGDICLLDVNTPEEYRAALETFGLARV